MSALVAAWHRLKALVMRRRLDRDLDDELTFHLAMREAAYVKSGVPAASARDAARRRFGNITHIKERTRDMWTFPSFESFAHDVRYALRMLRKSPGFTMVAVLALALGIGGNTAIFSLVDSMRGHALPYTNADRLVVLWGNVMRARVERRGASYPDFLDWRAEATSCVGMAAYDWSTMTLVGTGEPERITAETVSASYFQLLGLDAARGRTFRADEDVVGKAANVVVLGDGLWKRRFGADPKLAGRAVTLDSASYTVVGIMPAGFKGLTDQADVWIPYTVSDSPEGLADRGRRGFQVLARLKAGVPIAALQSELHAISRRLERAYPNTNEKRDVEVSPLDVEMFGLLRPALLTLMGAVAFVLLIACANVANLLLARSETRRGEIALRMALGAGWSRLLRQLVTESCVVTLIGAAAGLLIAKVSVRALIAVSPITFPSFVAPNIDARVAVFTGVVSLVCGLLVGLAPGLQARVSGLASELKESVRGSDGRRSQRLRSALVVAEMSLAVVLLVGAGLMIRSVRNLAALRPGFDPDSVLTLRVSVPRASAKPTAGPPPLAVAARTLLERVRSVAGVTAASIVSDVPLGGGGGAVFYAAEGQPTLTAQNVPRAYVHRVTPDFFNTMRIEMLSGRTFTNAEATPDSPAVVVSERVVKRFWPGQDPVGKRIKLGALTSSQPWLSIVGVVAEVKYRGLPENPTADPDLYFPFLDRNQQLSLVVRTGISPTAVAAPIREAIHATDSSIPVYSVATMNDLVSAQTSRLRFTMWLMGVFAGAALLLAVVGLYGVMSYLVTQRTREIGIRIALGATSSEVRRLIVGGGARMIGAGILVGVAASLGLMRLVRSLLYEVTVSDPAAAGAVLLLGLVALAACYIPAVRATRVDPVLALRHE
jgi:predicted permease